MKPKGTLVDLFAFCFLLFQIPSRRRIYCLQLPGRYFLLLNVSCWGGAGVIDLGSKWRDDPSRPPTPPRTRPPPGVGEPAGVFNRASAWRSPTKRVQPEVLDLSSIQGNSNC